MRIHTEYLLSRSVGWTEAAILYWANWANRADKAYSDQRLCVDRGKISYWANYAEYLNRVLLGGKEHIK